MCIFLGQKKYGIWGDFSEKFQVLCKNPDEVTRFDGTFLGIKDVLLQNSFQQVNAERKLNISFAGSKSRCCKRASHFDSK
jgi:hypothetical protein